MNKFLILLLLWSILGKTAFAAVLIKGKFELNNTPYELNFNYQFPLGQKAISQNIRFIEAMDLPDFGVVLPAHCLIDLTFSESYQVTITNLLDQKIVYQKAGNESFIGSSFGGYLENDKCPWLAKNWTAEIANMMRITETEFELNGKSYRFFIDAHALINAKGLENNQIMAIGFKPMKTNNGVSDGEVWIDTLPLADGSYQRIWFPLEM